MIDTIEAQLEQLIASAQPQFDNQVCRLVLLTDNIYIKSPKPEEQKFDYYCRSGGGGLEGIAHWPLGGE